MTDTPRTDAQHAKWRVDDDPYTNMTEFARQLERELNDERNVNALVEEIHSTGAALRAMPADAAPQGQEVCQHARLPNDRVPEPAVAAPRHGPGDTDEARRARLPDVIASYARAIRRKNEHGEWPVDSDFAIILERAAEALTIPSVARPFDPNVRLYAALNLLEQVYDEMQLQGWAMDGQWATATKKVLDEHGWSA